MATPQLSAPEVAVPQIVAHKVTPKQSGWASWVTTTDHKKIGIMYMVTTFVFFMMGGVEALLMRLQLSSAVPTLGCGGDRRVGRQRPVQLCSSLGDQVGGVGGASTAVLGDSVEAVLIRDRRFRVSATVGAAVDAAIAAVAGGGADGGDGLDPVGMGRLDEIDEIVVQRQL